MFVYVWRFTSKTIIQVYEIATAVLYLKKIIFISKK